MSWKRHFKTVKNNQNVLPQITDNSNGNNASSVTSSNFRSYLPMVYAGNPMRIQRYYQFLEMNTDSDINAALDTIADFSTQSEEHIDQPFELKYNGEPNETEVKILKTMMTKWIKLNNFKARLWNMFRDTLQNGDAFFLRDPETHEWLWLDHFMVEMVKPNQEDGKTPEEYFVRNLDYNKQTKFATKQADPNGYRTPYGTSTVGASRTASVSSSSGPAAFSLAGNASDPRQRNHMQSQEVSVIDAKHVVHLSLSAGNDINWPFGASILEPIFKVYKQKELLEDSVIIYRVQRAPERRIFYIDVGTMPPNRAKAHLEAVKNDIHQRRIPNRGANGQNMMDAAYNPLALQDDFYFANSSDGRGSRVETLPGGECIALDTKIPLLDGRTLTLQEIIDEYDVGKQLWVYSCNTTTGEIVPGMINWAGVTRKNAQVVKLTFDNGGSCIVTPDHKFPVQGREGLIEARNLSIGDSMIPLEFREAKPAKRSKNYTQFFDNKTKKWKFTHRMVAEYFREHDIVKEITFNEKYNDKKNTVHHIDFNRYNNNPENLSWVGYKDHYAYHSSIFKNYGHLAKEGIKRFYEEMTDEEYTIHCRMISDRIKLSIFNKTDAEKTEFIERSTDNLRKGQATEKQLWLLEHNPEWREKVLKNRSIGISKAFTDERKKIHSDDFKQRWKDGKFAENLSLQTLIFDEEILEKIIELIGPDTTKRLDLVKKINNSAVLDLIREKNKNTQARNLNIKKFIMSTRHLNSILKSKNIDWKTFRNNNLKSKLRKSKNFITNIDMFKSVVDYYKKGCNTSEQMINALNTDDNFMKIFHSLNKKIHHLSKNKIGRKHLITILQDNGYETWNHLKQESARFNHRLVSIEWLENKQDTGTITIDGAEIYHGYHNFAHYIGDGLIFTQNSLGEISDLQYFSKRLARGLRVPTSYLNLGDDEGGGNVAFNDGKLGAAMIQEFRFSKYCMRWQSLLAPTFDKEFKRFCVSNGIEMDWSLFELQFRPPQSFTKYRQIELDAQRVQVYQGVSDNKKLSERFKLLRFLGLTEDEMVENERMWSEENADKIKKKTGNSGGNQQQMDGLSSVGIRPMDDGMSGMNVDMNGLPEEPMPDMGGQPPGSPPGPGGPPPSGGMDAGGPAPA